MSRALRCEFPSAHVTWLDGDPEEPRQPAVHIAQVVAVEAWYLGAPDGEAEAAYRNAAWLLPRLQKCVLPSMEDDADA